MSNRKPSYTDLVDYAAATGLKKLRIAAALGVRPARLSALLDPQTYKPVVDDELARKIADILNQPVSHVKRIYARAA